MTNTVRQNGHETKEDEGAHYILHTTVYEDDTSISQAACVNLKTCLVCVGTAVQVLSIERKASKFSEVEEVGL